MMHAWNTTEDLYTESLGIISAPASGLVRNFPHQRSTWWLEPFYRNLMPTIVDAQTGYMFTKNHGKICDSILDMAIVNDIVNISRGANWSKDCRWVHVLRGYDAAHSSSREMFTAYMIVADLMIPKASYLERRKIMEQNFAPLGIRCSPKGQKRAFCVPRFTDAEGDVLWAAMHLQNQELEDSPTYGGIVVKREVSPYIFQKSSADTDTMNWMYHPFTNLY